MIVIKCLGISIPPWAGKIEVFFEASTFASSRHGGRMMEWWNIGSKIPSLAGFFLKGNISLINSFVNPARSGTKNPLSQFPQNHYFYPVKLTPISLGLLFQLGRSP
jgi:hypothetical protein